ncbi:MAG: PQQ-like beta-propeller repeat protein [Verrucomicrobiae bacterium]|nr:PQQ-like beta-propeller repeat protein [Verrucomicrobiae bacterium]
MKNLCPSNSTHPALVFAFTFSLFANLLPAADWPQWRGPNRNGLSAERGLLKAWPKDGPRLLWQAKDIGSGYSTPSVVGERLYLCSNEGLENEFVQALATSDGRRLWQARLGKVGNLDQKPEFPAARSTPTVVGEVLFALGSDGDLACVEIATGEVRWRKSLRADFGGKPGTWAYTESPLVDGDKLVCTPGGETATIVALNKRTGEVIWKCAVPGGDDAAYTSVILVEAAGVKQYVQMLARGLVGVDAQTGKFLWRYDRTVSRFKANIPTPVARGDLIYSAGAGTGGGVVRLRRDAESVSPEPGYFSPKLPATIGGAVVMGDHLFGTANSGLLCVDFASGEFKWDNPSLGAASLCLADGRLYLHGENGQVALVEATVEGYREKGRFTPPDLPTRTQPMEKAWTYPVVSHGRLYIRDQQMLYCYDVKAAPSGE